MTDKLSLYNGALREIKERRLLNLTESREPRRELDAVWADGAVQYCLEQGLWSFAMRSQMIEPSASVLPKFGYKYAYGKPADFVRTAAVCADEFFNNPITKYNDETDYWSSDYTPLYVKFVSNDAKFGNNMARWTQTFANFVELYLASKIVGVITQDSKITAEVLKKYEREEKKARGLDAMNQPALFMPAGSWVKARRGGRTNQNGGECG